ncbi:type III secretion protein [Chitinimonas sp. BJB300]|uniref:type III secretion protein n=1 Tax=Chitinimonas sp. BJB300 TaxID=1559339 RepID=UPI000C0F986B|nr:type III secretion protein [Chitinimonas sp. BJB300]PHV11483.1 type III secretion protein [Chitinimonas sp. BJB300]TSJ88520.1 type III secretion protein [Chitinimonas sp. BJB300]
MDLQWQRQGEYWLRLLEVNAVQVAPHMAVSIGEDSLYLEMQSGRTLISAARPVEAHLRQVALLQMLGYLQPEVSHGLPMRTWLAQGRIWLSVMAPAGSEAELWASLSKLQRRLLDRVMGSGHVHSE